MIEGCGIEGSEALPVPVLVRSFGKIPGGGDPAGVVLDAEKLTDSQMQAIATRAGYSETAFVEKKDARNFKVRFFTPTAEVDLCGHATIAVYALMHKQGLITSGEYVQELKAGILRVRVTDDGFVMMEQVAPTFGPHVSRDELSRALGVSRLGDWLEPQVVSTGLADILVPLRTKDDLHSLVPDMDVIKELSTKESVIGLHVFALGTEKDEVVAFARNFAPLYGIDEEAATGSSTGALAAYLFSNEMLAGRNINTLTFIQGEPMGNPCEIFVSLEIEGDAIKTVWVGGRAHVT